MNRVKTVTLLFYSLFAISIAIILNICTKLNQLFTAEKTIEIIQDQYYHLQKLAGMYGIISFIVLLSVSFLLYYLTSKRVYIFFSNFLYIGMVLFVFLTMNKTFYAFQNINFMDNSGYWLTMFIGVFYIIGAVLVSVIGFIAMRNITNRAHQKLINAERK